MSGDNRDLLNVDSHGENLVVSVAAGRLIALDVVDDFSDALHDLLEQRPERTWMIDFGGVTFMVTPAVNALLTTMKGLRSSGGNLILCGLNENIRRVFALMKLDQVFTIRESVAVAIEELARSDQGGS